MRPSNLFSWEGWRKRCTNLFFFETAVLSRSFEDKFRNFGKLQKFLCAFLEKPKAISPQRFISVFRGSFKTTVLLGFVVWIFCWSLALGTPTAIAYNTASKDNAEAFMSDFHEIILHNKLLHWIFPELPSKESEYRRFKLDKVEYKWVKFHVLSIDTTKPSRHYDIFINDDLENDLNAFSDTQRRDLLRKWQFQKSLVTRYEKFGIGLEIDVGTPYHFRGLVFHIMNNLPRYEKFIVPYKLDDETLSFPEMYTWEDFRRIKEEQSSDIFATQYELRYVDSQDRLMYPEWVTYWDYRPQRYVRRLVVDPAETENQKNCPTAITICDTDEDSNINVVLAQEVWKTPRNLLGYLQELNAGFRPDEIWCEKEKFSVVFKDLVEMIDPDLEISLIDHRGVPKPTRIIKIKPRLEMRKIRFARSGCELILQRLLDYPDCEYVDLPDNLAYQVQVSRPPDRGKGYHEEEEKEDSFETELKKGGFMPKDDGEATEHDYLF